MSRSPFNLLHLSPCAFTLVSFIQSLVRLLCPSLCFISLVDPAHLTSQLSLHSLPLLSPSSASLSRLPTSSIFLVSRLSLTQLYLQSTVESILRSILSSIHLPNSSLLLYDAAMGGCCSYTISTTNGRVRQTHDEAQERPPPANHTLPLSIQSYTFTPTRAL